MECPLFFEIKGELLGKADLKYDPSFSLTSASGFGINKK